MNTSGRPFRLHSPYLIAKCERVKYPALSKCLIEGSYSNLSLTEVAHSAPIVVQQAWARLQRALVLVHVVIHGEPKWHVLDAEQSTHDRETDRVFILRIVELVYRLGERHGGSFNSTWRQLVQA